MKVDGGVSTSEEIVKEQCLKSYSLVEKTGINRASSMESPGELEERLGELGLLSLEQSWLWGT